MNRDVLETLYVLVLAGCFGWELHRRLTQSPQVVFLPPPAMPLPHEEPRAAQVQCRCPRCAPPFHQESPEEVQ